MKRKIYDETGHELRRERTRCNAKGRFGRCRCRGFCSGLRHMDPPCAACGHFWHDHERTP